MIPARRFRAWFAALVCGGTCLGGLCLPQVAPAQAAAADAQPEAEFVYRFRPRDTLIGVSRRLLLQPQRWPELQRRNRIGNPLNIPPDTPLRIPYSWLKLRPDTAQVQSVSGTVTRGGARIAAGEILPEGTVLETGADGAVTIAFADGSVATLQKNSVLKLERLQQVEGIDEGHSARLQLDSGRIETVVQPRRDVGRFEIVTPVAVSAVRGTRFRTGFDPGGGAARTETTEGTVSVAAQRDTVAVPAGFGTRVDPGGAVLPPVVLLAAPDLAAVPQINTQPALQVRLPPVVGAVSYRVQLASDADFHALSVDAESADPEISIAALPDGDHWLRARAVDVNGIEGADAVRQISQRLLPAAPALTTPVAGARVIGTTGTFQWTAVPGAARYRAQLARDAQFAELVADREVTGTTQLDVGNLPAGRYFWRVASLDAQGEAGEWSLSQSYAQRPPAPLVAPPAILGRQMRLHWEERPGDRYRLQIARDDDFKRPLVDVRLDAAELTVRKPAPGTWYARVQLLDSAGIEDPFGEARRFDIDLPLWLRIVLPATILLPLLL